MKYIKTTICVAALLGIAILHPAAQAKQPRQITLTPIGRYNAGPGIESAEIAAYDPATKRIFSINPTLTRVDVLDISDPTDPVLARPIPLGGRPTAWRFITASSRWPSKMRSRRTPARWNSLMSMERR